MSDTLHVVCPHCDRTNRLPAARLTEAPNCGACHEALFTGHPLALDDARARDAELRRCRAKGLRPLSPFFGVPTVSE